MARPCKARKICDSLRGFVFAPRGVKSAAKPVRLEADEIEAIRLADFMGLYHDAAAKKMRVSRQTFGRIVERARKKTAEALLKGRTLELCCGRRGKNALKV
ncbi:MAG TPA: DUF134 domain-containing protein [Candidatus Goldiibacteriota bacterium]|nr:DUF134 domain-containing protein [Candidatus Goldiibacteriota bacterium]